MVLPFPWSLVFLIVLLCGRSSGGTLSNKKEEDELREREIGQPELLQYPTDQEAFNTLSTMAGIHRFISPPFPEIDARGFHESVFDNIGDFYPTWPRKLSFRSGSHPQVERYRNTLSKPRKKRHLETGGSNFKDGNETNEIEIQESIENDRRSGGEEESNETPIEIKKRDVGGGKGWGGRRQVRGMEMESAGFHGDTFHSGFGDFLTMKRKRKATYQENKPESEKFERNQKQRRPEIKREGYHSDAFEGEFGGDFETVKKRKPEMDSMGFHGDTFGSGFGDFETMKKRKPEMDSMGFHGDTFGGGFGDFETMKKRKPEMDSMGFHGDTFGGGFGDFETMKKRKPEMDSMGFHGDTFGSGFGDFETMKKRRPEMDSMGFYGDTFGGGFGDFGTMKKRKQKMDYMSFYRDPLGAGLGSFENMKKRKPEMDSMGFHGDMFGSGFGDFETMKKRKPEMDSLGFYGDTFGGGFGDFDTMKRVPLISGVMKSDMRASPSRPQEGCYGKCFFKVHQ